MRLALLALLPGCSMFMHSIERPKATVRDATVSTAGFAGITGRLQVDVMNPNDFGVPLSGVDWKLAIGGARAATGRVELSQTIPARGVAPVTTSLTVDARDVLAVAQQIATGARDYTVTADLHFATPVGNIDVEVARTGTIL